MHEIVLENLPQSQPVDDQADPPRIAVLVSGSGRTLKNIVAAIESGALHAWVVLVVASKECPGAEFARGRGITTIVNDRLDTAEEVGDLFDEYRIDWAVLAGYVRLLPIPERYLGRVVNIHPALLPRHGGRGMYGLRVHAAVIDAGDIQSGCTVHLADGAYDRGEIIAQAQCAVEPGDTPESLASRVFALETELYPKALSKLFASRR